MNNEIIKVLHCADLHLDAVLGDSLKATQFTHLSKNDQTLLRDAPLLALENILHIVDLEKVDVVVIAGDIFNRRDGVSSDIRTRSSFTNFLRKLSEQSVQVFIALGNHDPLNSIADLSAPWPDNVHLFSSRAPQTLELQIRGMPIAVHGVSYENNEENRNLASMFPEKIENSINIGVLHSNVGGNSVHSNYAPANIETLQSKNYDYFALGHIHQSNVLSEHPFIAYSGNTQALSAKPSEANPKGCIVSEISLGSGVINHSFIETDIVRYLNIDITIPEHVHIEDLPDYICKEIQTQTQSINKTYLVRLKITTENNTSLNAIQLIDLINEQSTNFIVTKISVNSNNFESDLFTSHPFFELLDRTMNDVQIPNPQDLYGKKSEIVSGLLNDTAIADEEFRQEIKRLVLDTHEEKSKAAR